MTEASTALEVGCFHKKGIWEKDHGGLVKRSTCNSRCNIKGERMPRVNDYVLSSEIRTPSELGESWDHELDDLNKGDC